MTRRYMLDTNTVSNIVKGRSAAARLQLSQHMEIISISAITEAELLYGLARKPYATALHAALRPFLKKTEVLPWRHEEAILYGNLRVAQESIGRRLEPMDLLIAAHAISTQSILVSSDKAFMTVPELVGLENWATDI